MKRKFVGIIFLATTVLAYSPLNSDVVHAQRKSVNKVVLSKEKKKQEQVIYSGDKVINKYLISYNQKNPDDVITPDMFDVYYHHGRKHDNQIKFFNKGGFEIVITNTIGNIEIVIDKSQGEQSLKTVDEFKAEFKKFAKASKKSVTDDELEQIWNDAFANYGHYSSKTLEVSLTSYDSKVERIMISGKTS
ncbi:hypothetical protein GPZ88_08280 [Streptococcus ruminicola]|uniref:Uncharacterized protein n=1 Tax=Streptococcus ruminicola TaxID=2686210 RepID=A0A6G8I1P8_9STRE|nr:hypothetical protein [Streptococcus ruminicola]QIM47030.1 hypothetical protein GPZ88_08280 [Streptococcus ruminicola]